MGHGQKDAALMSARRKAHSVQVTNAVREVSHSPGPWRPLRFYAWPTSGLESLVAGLPSEVA